MAVTLDNTTTAPKSRLEKSKRKFRDLSPAERKIKVWISRNYGQLSVIARELNLSPQFVQRIAYNREARSKGLVVERRLMDLGCPLIQKLR